MVIASLTAVLISSISLKLGLSGKIKLAEGVKNIENIKDKIFNDWNDKKELEYIKTEYSMLKYKIDQLEKSLIYITNILKILLINALTLMIKRLYQSIVCKIALKLLLKTQIDF